MGTIKSVRRRHVIAISLLLIVTVAAMVAAAVASPLFLVIPYAFLPVVATWAFPKSIWPFVPLTIIVITPSLFLVNGEPYKYGDAVQKAIVLIALLCFAVALGLRWSWLGAAAVAVVGFAGLATLLNIGGRVEVGSEVLARASAGYCLPFLFLFINWRRLDLQRGLEYVASLPLVCLFVGVGLQIAGVKGLPIRAPMPGIYVMDQGVPRLQGALVPAHLAALAVVAIAAALCLAASPNTVRSYRIHFWLVVNFVILMATLTRSEIAVGVALIVTYVVYTLARNRSRSLRERRKIWVVAAIVIAGCAIAVPALMMRNAGTNYEKTFNTSGRAYVWQFFQGFVAEDPLAGKGLGFSSIAVALYSPDRVQKTFFAPHNEYLRLTVDGGIFFALGLFLVLILAFVIAARAQSGVTRALVAVFALGTMALSFVDNTLSAVQYSVLVVILLGLLTAHPTSRMPGPQSANTGDRDNDDSFSETEVDRAPDNGVSTYRAEAVGPAQSESGQDERASPWSRTGAWCPRRTGALPAW